MKGTYHTRAVVAVAVILVLGAFMTGCDQRHRLTERERVEHCVNRICPISGEPLGAWAFAANYRGYLVGVRNSQAVESWEKLPESQQQEMLRDIDGFVLR